MDIFGVELEDLQDVYKEKMVPYLGSDSFIGSTADKAAALMNPALAKTFDVLSCIPNNNCDYYIDNQNMHTSIYS